MSPRIVPTTIIAVLLVLTLPLVHGCDSSNPAQPPDGGGSGGGGGGGGLVDGESTYGAIDDAIAKGEITPGEGLLYKLQSLYNPTAVPSRFRGGSTFSAEATVLDDAAEVYNGLSAADQEKILPYLVSPIYEGSWWDLQRGSRTDGESGELRAPTSQVTGKILNEWKHIDTPDGNVRVWFAASVDSPYAQTVADAMTATVWTQLTDLMGIGPRGDGDHGSLEGDSPKYDFIVMALPDPTIFGLCKPVMGNFTFIPPCDETPTYVEINTSKTLPTVRSTVAHEFMHALQRSLNFNGCDEYRWLREATATWAQDYCYEGDNYEWTISSGGKTFPRHFLDQTTASMDNGDGRGPYSYGAYLFFQYLARGFSPSWIRYIWENAGRSDSADAIDAGLQAAGATSLEERWPQFSRFLWNQGPVEKLKDWDGLTLTPRMVRPTMTASVTTSNYSDTLRLDVSLPRLSSLYYEIELPDASVSGFHFVNGWTYDVQAYEWDEFMEPGLIGLRADPIPADELKGRSVHLLYLVPGIGWLQEDLTKSPAFSFCRDVADGKVERVVLVFANGDVEAADNPKVPPGMEPFLWFDNIGCSKWSGTFVWDVPDPDGHFTISANYTWSSFADQFGGFYMASGGEDLEYLTQWSFEPVSGSMTWSMFGTDGTCTYQGEETWPVDEYALYDQVLVRSLVLEGGFERTFRADLFSVQQRTVTEHVSGPPEDCPEDFTYSLSSWYLEIPHGYSQAVISPDGRRIDVRYTSPGDDTFLEMKLQAIR